MNASITHAHTHSMASVCVCTVATATVSPPYILALQFAHEVGRGRPGNLHDLLQLVQVWQAAQGSRVKGHTLGIVIVVAQTRLVSLSVCV